MITRRGILGSLLAAPAIVTAANIMPVRQLFSRQPIVTLRRPGFLTGVEQIVGDVVEINGEHWVVTVASCRSACVRSLWRAPAIDHDLARAAFGKRSAFEAKR